MVSVEILLYCLLFVSFTRAVLTNYTIDDTYGDERTHAFPTYSGSWLTDRDCGNKSADPLCQQSLSTSQAFSNTWHGVYRNTTDTSTVTITFNGTAIYIYHIIPDYLAAQTPEESPNLGIQFTVDGERPDDFTVTSPSGTRYNILTYLNSALPNSEHTIVMETNRQQIQDNHTYIMVFDYAVYSLDLDGTSTIPGLAGSSTGASGSSSTNSLPSAPAFTVPVQHHNVVGAAVGGSLGGLAIILASVLLIEFYRRKTREAQNFEQAEDMELEKQDDPDTADRAPPFASRQEVFVDHPPFVATQSHSLMPDMPSQLQGSLPTSQVSHAVPATVPASAYEASMAPPGGAILNSSTSYQGVVGSNDAEDLERLLEQQVQSAQATVTALRARGSGTSRPNSSFVGESVNTYEADASTLSRIEALEAQVVRLQAERDRLQMRSGSVGERPPGYDDLSIDPYQREITSK